MLEAEQETEEEEAFDSSNSAWLRVQRRANRTEGVRAEASCMQRRASRMEDSRKEERRRPTVAC